MTTAAAPQPIEIFRPGTHTPMSGGDLTFSEADLAACAAGYDPAKHEAPLCVGHPSHDLPAYGWVQKVRFAEGGLVVDPAQVDPAFAELVKAGRYKKVSAAFFPPTHPSNPTPGRWYLRHVGFLGAQPPAVKGLKPVAFAGEEAGVVVFGEDDGDDLILARLFRGLRDWMIGKFGAVEADKALPPDSLNFLQEQTSAPETPDPVPPIVFSDPKEPAPPMTVTIPEDLKKREADLAAREVAFAERDREARHRDNLAFLDKVIGEGRAPHLSAAPERARVVAFMDRLDGAEVVAFAEGAEGKATALDEFKRILGAVPKAVEFAEIARAEAADATVAFAAPAGFTVDAAGVELHAKALAHQQKTPHLSYMDAVKAVSGR